ncbi:YraN family protein [Paraconexibacter sp.]|uniref:YraN family protein n=1 Tax=Paraconexibacter sp. TaxID=2949640 RepID=UPI0035656825
MPPADHRQRLGRLGEDLAAAHLERLGFAIVARNHRTRHGEIDLIACDERTLVICEVKTRRGAGRPWDSLHERKRAQVRRMAAAYLAAVHDRPRAAEIRLDAIGVVVDAADRLVALEHLEGAL